jgi:hypothetical protein
VDGCGREKSDVMGDGRVMGDGCSHQSYILCRFPVSTLRGLRRTLREEGEQVLEVKNIENWLS